MQEKHASIQYQSCSFGFSTGMARPSCLFIMFFLLLTWWVECAGNVTFFVLLWFSGNLSGMRDHRGSFLFLTPWLSWQLVSKWAWGGTHLSITTVLCCFSCVLGIFVNVVNVLFSVSEELILWALCAVCVWINTHKYTKFSYAPGYPFIWSKLQ